MLIILSLVLFVLLILIGDERGVASAFTLVGNIVVMVAYVYILSKGANVYISTFFVTIIISTLTLFAQNGVNIKTISAVMAVGIVMLGLLCICAFIVYRGKLGGYSEIDLYEEDVAFLYNEIKISAYEIMTAVVLLSLLGAIMDTALAISTAIFEVNANNKDLTMRELIKSGDNIGKDIIGTTINTLLFAGMGESMFLMMLFARYKYTFLQLINSKAFIQELFIIGVSNIGCIIIIPLTSLITAYFLKKEKTEIQSV